MRVLGRIRLSRESNETGTSIERQREAVEQWSAMHGHDVIGWGGGNRVVRAPGRCAAIRTRHGPSSRRSQTAAARV